MGKQKRHIKKIISVIIIVIIALFVIKYYNSKEKVDSEYLGSRLTKVGELTTVKLNYNGFAEYEDKGVPIFNKSNFLMTYEAVVRVGIDLEKTNVKVDNDNKTIILDIPKAKILDVKINPSSIKYYDTKFSLFNMDQKEDANKAQDLVKKQAYKEVSQMGVIDSANEQVLTLIKGLLQDAVPKDYTYKLKDGNNTDNLTSSNN